MGKDKSAPALQRESFEFAYSIVSFSGDGLKTYDFCTDHFHSDGEAASLIWFVYLFLILDEQLSSADSLLTKIQAVHRNLFLIDGMDPVILPDWAREIFDKGPDYILHNALLKSTTLRIACDMSFIAELAVKQQLPDPKDLYQNVPALKG